MCELKSAGPVLCWALLDMAVLENGHLVGTLPLPLAPADGFVSPAAVAKPADAAASGGGCWWLPKAVVDGPEVATPGAELRWRTPPAEAVYCAPPRPGHDGPAVVGASLGPPASNGAPAIHACRPGLQTHI